MTKAIIFDLDGTLLQTHIHSCAAAHETLARLGLTDVANEAVERLIGEPPEVFFGSLAPGYPDMASLEALFDALEQEMLTQRGTLFDGVSALLEQLEDDGYLLALCSNGSRAYVACEMAGKVYAIDVASQRVIAEITAGERRKVVLHIDACAVHVRAVVCCCITKVLRANFTPVNGGTGDGNAEFLTGWFSCASHVDNPVEWFLYGHDGRA